MKNNDSTFKRIESILKAKERFHKDRANLSFEEKIKMVVKLQQIASEISKISKKKVKKASFPVWKLD